MKNVIQFRRKDQPTFVGFNSLAQPEEQKTLEELFLTTGSFLSLVAPVILSIATGEALYSVLFAFSSVLGILVGSIWFYVNNRRETGLKLQFQPKQKPYEENKLPKAA